MKKIIGLLIVIISFFIFVGCNFKLPPENITYEIISPYDEEIYIDDFKLEDVKIKVIYQNGDYYFVPVEEQMLLKSDIAKLSLPGEHQITVVYRYFTGTFSITLIKDNIIDPEVPVDPEDPANQGTVFEPTMSYYESAKSLSGENLKLKLRVIISVTTHKTTYDELRQYLVITDADPDISGNLIMLYTKKSLPGTWDNGATWNREHVWPQSLGWFKTSGAGADLHHLRPSEPSVNSSRGNKRFGESGSSYYIPDEEVRGDIARILFYMYVRYSEADSYSLTQVAQSFDMLLRWNKADPVDDFERNRNQKTYELQGNRNPFIDYPECADLIWNIQKISYKGNEAIIITIVWYCSKESKNEFFI